MEEKNQVGRPTVYKPEYCDKLIEHMSQGLSFESFGAITNTCKDTLYEWVKKHQEFADAKKIAFQHCRLFWERLGVEHILNVSETNEEGKSRTSKSKSLNPSVWIYNMKCRFRDEWMDKQEIEHKGDGIKIVIDKEDEQL